jgi:threonine/homoserine/homoserine lactone efflux protein
MMNTLEYVVFLKLGTQASTLCRATFNRVLVSLLTFLFTVETLWNTFVARIFSLPATRRAYVGAKSLMDRSFGTLLALLGAKIAVT